MYTRAMAALRLPIAFTVSIESSIECVYIYRLGLLGFVLMLRAGIYIEVAEQFVAQAILRQHALHDFTEEAILAFGHEACGRCLALSAGVAGVAQIDAICPLIAGHTDLLGIDHDDIVPTIDVRGEVGFVLAA